MRIKTIFKSFIITAIMANALVAAPLVRSLTISHLNEQKQIIDGIEYPRINETKYRGVEPIQMDRNKAIKAMLGDENANIESILFSAVKLKLMNEDVPFISLVVNIFVDRNLSREINKAVSKNNNRYFNEKDASQKALTIIEESIQKHIWKKGFLRSYVDYKSYSLELWAKEVIFSTVYLEVANIYSKDIVVLEDSKNNQMLDLNYWNKINNGSWVFTVHPWVDKGEFITPIYISNDKVVGFKQYESKWLSHQIYQDLQNNLSYAYFKDDNKKEILIFDGTNKKGQQQAIVKENGIYYYAYSRFSEYADVPKQLAVSKDKANIIGIIKLCPKTSPCTLYNSAFGVYPKSSKTVPGSVINSIASININNHSPKVFYYNGTLSASADVTDAYSYVNSLSPQAFNKKISKKEKDYKSDLSNITPTTSRNKLVYDLNDIKITKNSALYLHVPRSFRNEAIKEIQIKVRQDIQYETSGITSGGQWDDSPGYASIQFHSSNPNEDDRWRYSAISTRNPKGSLFAELATTKKVKNQDLDVWHKHKGSSEDNLSMDILKFDSIRIVNVGTDPIIVNKLEVKLK